MKFAPLPAALLSLLHVAAPLVAQDPVPSQPEIRAAVTRSLPLLVAGAKGSMEERKQCFTCHNQGLPLLALATARSRGFEVDADHMQAQLAFIDAFLARNRQNYLEGKGTGGQADTAGYALYALSHAGWKPTEATAAVAGYLLLYQKEMDHWQATSKRPPSEQSAFTTTFLALRGLKSYGTPDQQEQIERRTAQARDWLLRTPAADTEDRVFRLRALHLAAAPPEAIDRAAEELLKCQRPDGGWPQLEDKESDAYATGSALAALNQTGRLPAGNKAYLKGLAYLIKTQLEDGSWHVVSRSDPFQTYFESGYPHGNDQFISIAAAGWATIALALALPESTAALAPRTVRVAACQARRRSIDWRLASANLALTAVEKNLDELEEIVQRAGESGCTALALPEDTLGLLDWLGVNQELAGDVLPRAVARMQQRLGGTAARYSMYLVCCSDNFEREAGLYNTAFLLGRDGRELGRYHKVCPTWAESGLRKRGQSFPVFSTEDLGTVGLAICYDLVMPETARCLALAGADVIFFPTMGTAAVGDDDIGLQALRVRAAENQVWLVVAHRGDGAMIISPRGKIVARAEGPDGLAIADIDPHGGREGGDSSNTQRDMRARLFRERNPAAFSLLVEPEPPVLANLPIDLSREEAGRIFARMLTHGEEEFRQAQALAAKDKAAAIAAFERLISEYPSTWIDRAARERLAALRGQPATAAGKQPPGNAP